LAAYFSNPCSFVSDQKESIRGTALADDGDPVADVQVYAELMQGSKILTVPNAKPDDLGGFALSGPFADHRGSCRMAKLLVHGIGNKDLSEQSRQKVNVIDGQ
jgi:hypothetical protein